MYINTSDVSFSAKPINKVQIKQYSKELNQFLPIEAQFALFDGKNKFDRKAIKLCANKWKDAELINAIERSAKSIARGKNPEGKLFILTTQTDNLENLDTSKILGFADTRENKKNIYLDYLQINPAAINYIQKGKPEFKECGNAVVKSLQSMYNLIVLLCTNDEKVRNFYEQNGFVKTFFNKRILFWVKNPILRYLAKISELFGSCFNLNPVN